MREQKNSVQDLNLYAIFCYLADLEAVSEDSVDSVWESVSDSCGRVSCPN